MYFLYDKIQIIFSQTHTFMHMAYRWDTQASQLHLRVNRSGQSPHYYHVLQ